ncbi:MAG: geranylgeranyl pyrophosphate synthase [Mariniblastus sp.]|jgi:geranylgeranyl pyrophosphate synthase
MSDHTTLKPRTGNSTLRPRPGVTRVPRRLWQAGIFDPLNHILQSEGKRLRADLVTLSYQLAGGLGAVPNDLIEFVELLHAGSLVIDDIEDESEMRRGQPTLHKVVGTPLAINTGNWMYFSALEKLQDLPLDSTQLCQVMGETITTIRRCHEGQALDLTAKVLEMDRLHIYPTVRAISRLKTGGVTALAAKLGAVLAGGNPSSQKAFHSFGMQLGIGIQMLNDFAELKSSSEFGGRSDDLRNARVTWPWAWLSRLRSERQFAELQCMLLETSQDNMHEVAATLLSSTSEICASSIQRKIKGAISCLKNELYPNSSSALNSFLNRIEGYRA